MSKTDKHFKEELFVKKHQVDFNNPYTAISIQCGEGKVEISLVTGEVTTTNCTLNEAAKAFWRAVALHFPQTRNKAL